MAFMGITSDLHQGTEKAEFGLLFSQLEHSIDYYFFHVIAYY